MTDSFRHDPLTDTWVLVATARRGIPVTTVPAEAVASCPFCPGRESETEATVAATPNDGTPWRIRVVRNRFPSVTPEAQLAEVLSTRTDSAPASGVHEVILESREHDVDWPDFTPEHAASVVATYRDRFRALSATPGIRAVTLFRNRGRRAGGSQRHPHAQAIATALVPSGVASRHRIAVAHAASTGRAPLDDAMVREHRDGIRLVVDGAAWTVVCPFASHRSYETWIVPNEPLASFALLDDAAIESLARLLLQTLQRTRRVTGDAAYNVIVRSPPSEGVESLVARSYVEILPRISGDAGFELASGMDIVPVAPEDAAAELRRA